MGLGTWGLGVRPCGLGFRMGKLSKRPPESPELAGLAKVCLISTRGGSANAIGRAVYTRCWSFLMTTFYLVLGGVSKEPALT